jgi:tight adherence protein B
MGLALFAFVIVAGTIVGGYAAVMYLPDMLAGRKLERRLRDVSTPGEGEGDADSTILKRASEGPLPAIDRLFDRSGAGAKLKRLIDQSGTRVTPSAVMLTSLFLGCGAAFLATIFSTRQWVLLVAAPIGFYAPFGWLMHKRSSRMKRFEEQFPEALDLLSRAIRAGHAFQTAMGMCAEELHDPVGPEFKKAFDQQNFGLPLKDALNQLAERVPHLDVRFFVTAVQIQRETGGNLAEILDNLAHVVRERFKILRQIRVHTAHGRFTGYVLLALPAALAVALSFINPDHMGLLFHEKMGQVMLMGAVVMQAAGFVWIRQVIKIEV